MLRVAVVVCFVGDCADVHGLIGVASLLVGCSNVVVVLASMSMLRFPSLLVMVRGDRGAW